MFTLYFSTNSANDHHFIECLGSAAYALQDTQPEARSQMPFMDHWNVSRPHVSLRDIIKEQQALQENVKKVAGTPKVSADTHLE